MDPGKERARLTAAALKDLLGRPFLRAEWDAMTGDALHVRIANAPVSTNKAASLDQLETFLARVQGFGCGYCELWQRREAIYAETEVHFIDADAHPQAIPCIIVARAVGGLIVDMRFHLDPSPIP